MTTALTVVDEAMRALEVATDVRDVVRIRNEAKVLQALVERARLGFEATLRVSELEVRAARRAGSMLIDQGAVAKATLDDLNIQKWEAHRWQEIARIPDEMLDAYIERQRQERRRVTVGGFVGFSSESNEWYTPDNVLDLVYDVLGRVDLDPCAEAGRRHNVHAAKHYTEADDGLAQQWNGTVFLNPPYGDTIPLWTAKLVGELTAGRCTQAIALVPARTDTAWFVQLAEYDRLVCFVTGRLVFKSANGRKPVGQSATFPSAIVGFGVRRAKFIDVFRPMGLIYERVP